MKRVDRKTWLVAGVVLGVAAIGYWTVSARGRGSVHEVVPTSTQCRALDGSAGLLAPGKVVAIGEIHGTTEAPAIVAELACGAAGAGLPLHVGLEMLAEDQPALDRFLDSDGSTVERAALVESHFWSEVDDGRTSVAMLDLVERLRVLRHGGKKIEVFLFDAALVGAGAGASERDAAMARNVLAALGRSPRDAFLVLCGNVHAKLATGTSWDPAYVPMMRHVRDEGVPSASLAVVYGHGSAWNDNGDGTPAAHPLVGDDDGPFGLVEQNPSSDGAWSGKVHLGKTTASPPAVRLLGPR